MPDHVVYHFAEIRSGLVNEDFFVRDEASGKVRHVGIGGKAAGAWDFESPHVEAVDGVAGCAQIEVDEVLPIEMVQTSGRQFAIAPDFRKVAGVGAVEVQGQAELSIFGEKELSLRCAVADENQIRLA